MTDSLKTHLSNMRLAFIAEHQEAKRRFAQNRESMSLSERVEKGLAIDRLQIDDFEAGAGRLRIHLVREKALAETTYVRIRRGTPLVVWSPDEPNAQNNAVLLKLRRRGTHTRVELAMNSLPEWVQEASTLVIEEDAPQVTFDRGMTAIDTILALVEDPKSHESLEKQDLVRWLEELHIPTTASCTPSDSQETLNLMQAQAVANARAHSVSLIHGPPGTGKTQTLVQHIKFASHNGERVLVVAPSNTAVDNVAERLIQAGISTVRVGHPARVSETLQAHTLDHLVRDSDAYKLSRKFYRDANSLRKKTKQKSLRGYQGRSERRALFREAKNLTKDARRQLDEAAKRTLRGASVVCVTCASAAGHLFEDLSFDRLVVDEATQSLDPLTWVAIHTALSPALKSITFAGDPKQLPPTVLHLKPEHGYDLRSTLFERLAERAPSRVTMLTTQYRMNEAIMSFPSQSMYDSKLEAHPSVADRTLSDFCKADALRDAPWTFIDTAGKGYSEKRDEDDPSTQNPGNAERVRGEILRLMSRGLSASDIAVITPYDAQVRLLRSLLEEECSGGLEVNSIDGFQGRESEVVVIDLVRSNEDGQIGFLSDIRRMNVALTRAKRYLLVVGDSATLSSDDFYLSFIDHAEKSGALRSAWEDNPEDDTGITT